jgi:hypothetical protein
MSNNIEFKHMEQGIWIESNISHFMETNVKNVKNQCFFNNIYMLLKLVWNWYNDDNTLGPK